jgi:ankyrin repeat protein
MNRTDGELIVSARLNNLPEVLRLLRFGADVNAKNNLSTTPLIEACKMGHLQVLNELLSHGADIESENSFGWRPLHWASWNGHLAVVIELLGHGAESLGATTSLLGKHKSRGANAEAQNIYGNTPLHFASVEGHVAIVQALLRGGANILTANNQGKTPIHKAVSRGNSEASKYLLQHYYATTRRLPLHELVEDLTWIGNPGSIDVPPLCAALHKNVLSTDDVVGMVEYLVAQNPALLRSRDHDGSLPLHVACRRGASFTIVQSLMNLYKASVKSVTSQGDLPLFLACETPETSLDTIFMLIKLYPDLVY